MRKRRVGVVGGGQLALMLGEAAPALGITDFNVLDATPDCPAAPVATRQVVAAFDDAAGLAELARISDTLTFEIELAGAAALHDLVAQGVSVQPSPGTLATIQDKLVQKQFLASHGVPTAPFCVVDAPTRKAVEASAETLGYPLVLKARRGGYDGRGNALVEGPDAIEPALARLGQRPLYAEALVPFAKELAVMVARSGDGSVRAFPVVETVHVRHICEMTIAPAPIAASATRAAIDAAVRAVADFDGAGIFGVELFVTDQGDITVNEIAPRPHNSGHYTIEGCRTSQFSQHLRAVTDQPLGATDLVAPVVVMLNILGDNAEPRPARPSGMADAERLGAHVHLYGKRETRFDRKMGHLTVLGDDLETTIQRARAARAAIHI